MTRIPVRILVGGLAAGLAVTGTAYAVLPDSTPPAPETVSAQAQAVPSVIPARPVHRASRGGGRAALPPMTSVTKTVATGATFSGEASWYGGYFQGRRTASGERFNTYDLTAASKTLPFGTRLRVCRRGTCVVVRVNDRGPYVGSRVLDLSQAAAQRLGYSGVAHVTATPVGVRTVSVVDVAEVARLRAVDRRRAAVARHHAVRAAQLRAERSRAEQVELLTVQAASTSPLENAWPSVAAATGLLLAGSGGLVHARRRRARL